MKKLRSLIPSRDEFYVWSALMLSTLILGLALFLTSCATAPIALPKVPGVGVLPIVQGETVFHLTDEKKANLISRGVPADWLSSRDARGWILSQEHENEAADILLKDRNP